MISSASPSEKYSWSCCSLRSAKGSTATDGVASAGAERQRSSTAPAASARPAPPARPTSAAAGAAAGAARRRMRIEDAAPRAGGAGVGRSASSAADHRRPVAGPLHRVLGQHPAHQLAQPGPLRHLEGRRRARAGGRAPHVVGEGELAGEHPVEQDAQREDVGPLVLRRAAPLLGCHVAGGAAVEPGPAEGVGHAEVEHLHRAVVAEEDVVGLQVVVGHAARVGERQARGPPPGRCGPPPPAPAAGP